MIVTDGKRPPAGSAAEVKLDAYESLDDDGKAFIDQLAHEVSSLFYEEGVEPARLHMETTIKDCDGEWRLALWWKLHSQVRTALKKHAAI